MLLILRLIKKLNLYVTKNLLILACILNVSCKIKNCLNKSYILCMIAAELVLEFITRHMKYGWKMNRDYFEVKLCTTN